MLILGFDTATPACTVALAERGALLAEATVISPRVHSARLLPLLAQVLAEAGRKQADLTGIAVGVGPGSFTGLRIGLATAKGLAYALGLECAPVSSLAAMAHGLARPGPAAVNIVPMLDARRGSVYTALYAGAAEVVAPGLRLAEEWMQELVSMAAPIIFAGDAVSGPLRQLAERALGERAYFPTGGEMWPRGGAVAELGLHLLQKGQGVHPAALQPVYLRRSTPEANAEIRAAEN